MLAGKAKRKKMSSSTPDTFRAAVLTVSDSCARGERNDLSGPAVSRALQEHHFAVVETRTVADDHAAIQKAIVDLARKVRLVVTTGGTGISTRDVTPEATRSVCGRMLDGVSERMRREGEKKTPFAALSRGLCGVCGTSLVLNLPGSPTGAVEALRAVIDVLPHAIQILSGKTEHMSN
jgi:molybdenum cofactor synthesis domain-containing protein